MPLRSRICRVDNLRLSNLDCLTTSTGAPHGGEASSKSRTETDLTARQTQCDSVPPAPGRGPTPQNYIPCPSPPQPPYPPRVNDPLSKFLYDNPSISAIFELVTFVGMALSLRMGVSQPRGIQTSSPAYRAAIPKAPSGAVIRPGEVAASSSFTLGQRLLRFAYGITGGKLSGAGPSNTFNMAVPFSRFRSRDTVLRALESSPQGHYIGRSGVQLSEMPSQRQFAELTRLHKTEFALMRDPNGQVRLYQGTADSVRLGPGNLLTHTHPMQSIVPKGYPWAPSRADVDALRQLNQYSSVIVMSSGESFTFTMGSIRIVF